MDDQISGEMSVETLIKILRVQSNAIAAHEATIKALKQRNEELFTAQNLLRQNCDTLFDAFNRLSKAFEKALPRAGAGPQAN